MVVYVNLWRPSRVDPLPYATVHRPGCDRIPQEPGGKWREVEDEHAADHAFFNRSVYRCSRRTCFPGDTDRHIPRRRR